MFQHLRMFQDDQDSTDDVAFDDISRVVPWLEMSIVIVDVDINGPQKSAPRGSKSHLHYQELPSGMRYLVNVRDPKEAFMSMSHFFEAWLFEPGTIRPEAFTTTWMTVGPIRVDYCKHLMSWWSPRLPIPGAIAEQIDIQWVKHITPETGQADFAAMAHELHQHLSACTLFRTIEVSYTSMSSLKSPHVSGARPGAPGSCRHMDQ